MTLDGMIEKLFQDLERQLDSDGTIVHPGKLADATIVEVQNDLVPLKPVPSSILNNLI